MDQVVTITTATTARIRGGDNADIVVEFNPDAKDRSNVVQITQEDVGSVFMSRSEAYALMLSLDGMLGDDEDEDAE